MSGWCIQKNRSMLRSDFEQNWISTYESFSWISFPKIGLGHARVIVSHGPGRSNMLHDQHKNVCDMLLQNFAVFSISKVISSLFSWRRRYYRGQTKTIKDISFNCLSLIIVPCVGDYPNFVFTIFITRVTRHFIG